jgi:hypothetical protein
VGLDSAHLWDEDPSKSTQKFYEAGAMSLLPVSFSASMAGDEAGGSPVTFPLRERVPSYVHVVIHVARGVVGKRTRFSWYTVCSQWQVGQAHFLNYIPRLVLDWLRKLLWV